MNSNIKKYAYQSTVDENEKASHQKQTTNKEKCGKSQELLINEKTQSKSKGILIIYKRYNLVSFDSIPGAESP
jgi:hypothetical protein